MLLERHFDPKRPVNIHELSVEAPQKEEELPFDPERDLTEEDWERMKEQLKVESDKVPFYLEDMVNLFPERESELAIENYEADLRRIFKNAWRRKDMREILRLGRQLKTLFPERIADLRLDGPYWEEIKTHIAARPLPDIQFSEFIAFKILFPSYDCPPWVTSKILASVDLNKGSLGSTSPSRWQLLNLAHALMGGKVLFPDMKELVAPLLNPLFWKEMKKSFVEVNQESIQHPNRMSTMIRCALDMKILAAEEVKITDKGLEILMRETRNELQPSSAPLPRVRKF